ncbi:MAG: AMP-binding protein [Bdellovibrionaceae bacterium]|nr:AMP-binding protein [Bdellovibrio sp.]
MAPFNFSEDANNQLLLNPRLSQAEQDLFFELQLAFEKEFGLKNYFLVPSSGSSKKLNESIKLIALHREAVLNSARRFNQYFHASANDHWGLVLPLFHVAGLGTCARSFLAGAKVIENGDDPEIRFLSMVPTQVYDLVVAKTQAPPNLKSVFIGAGQLNEEVKQLALALKWPLIETYGMTETASMVAVQINKALKALPGVTFQTTNQQLKISCDSLLTASIQKIDQMIQIKKPVQDGFYLTEDLAELRDDLLILKGRASEYVKISGEGVSLSELNEKLESVALKRALPLTSLSLLAISQPRKGHELILAVEKSVDSETIKLVVQEFNQKVRPYEKIKKTVLVQRIPRSDLKKVKSQELSDLIIQTVKAERSK